MRYFVLVASLLLASCTNGPDAERVLRAQGYDDIRTGGYDPFACSEDDTFRTSFAARAPSGQTVTGTVCKGWFKGSTVRLD